MFQHVLLGKKGMKFRNRKEIKTTSDDDNFGRLNNNKITTIKIATQNDVNSCMESLVKKMKGI